ncbi:MAG: hypothetical protein DVS81_17375 [Candidatus Accumulibacter meliphilus]|jgi:hypothetical protein|uniref:Uncharacterized protein n=1 Tax=Candidatus Accumulibacter meliphilus TaxID=2211374 RepID=A0A369XPI4_9PROT|nr:MAG: hypothetical protein DVS81_17375 [Candidatus Accumulibacter meliphilus]
MTASHYELRFPDLGGLEAPELQRELGPTAKVITPDRPAGAYGDLGLVTIGVILGAKVLTAALLYFARNERKTKIRLTAQVVSPDGTITNIALEVDSSEKEALSEQAMKQIAAALKVKASDLVGLE